MRTFAAAVLGLSIATVATAQSPPPSAVATPGNSAPAAHLVIQQAFGEGSNLTFYVDAIDAGGKPLSGVTKNQVAIRGAPEAEVRVVRSLAPDDGVGYIVLLDRSGSTRGQSPEIGEALKTWIRELSPYDRMAIVTFGDSVVVAQDFTDDRRKLEAAVEVSPTDSRTYLYKALEKGAELARVEDAGLPRRRTIVIVSDGVNDEKVTGLEPEDVRDIVKAAGVPVFAMDASEPTGQAANECEPFLGRITSVSNGLCTRLAGGPAQKAFDTIHDAIQRVLVVEAKCGRCRGDGSRSPYSVQFTVGSRVLPSEPYPVTLGPGHDSEPSIPPWIWWAVAAAVVSVILMAVIWVWNRQRHDRTLAEERRNEELRRIEAETRKSPGGNGQVTIKDGTKDTNTQTPKAAPEGPIQARLELVVVGGSRAGDTFRGDLRKRLVLGSDLACDIFIPDDPTVAGRQCEFTWQDGDLFVSNLAAPASMAVSGSQVTRPRKLANWDTFRVGSTELRLMISDGA